MYIVQTDCIFANINVSKKISWSFVFSRCICIQTDTFSLSARQSKRPIDINIFGKFVSDQGHVAV